MSLLHYTFKRARDFEILLDDVIWRFECREYATQYIPSQLGGGKEGEGEKQCSD